MPRQSECHSKGHIFIEAGEAGEDVNRATSAWTWETISRFFRHEREKPPRVVVHDRMQRRLIDAGLSQHRDEYLERTAVPGAGVQRSLSREVCREQQLVGVTGFKERQSHRHLLLVGHD